jgi:hypothetical protein
LIPKFASELAARVCELRNRDTSRVRKIGVTVCLAAVARGRLVI